MWKRGRGLGGRGGGVLDCEVCGWRFGGGGTFLASGGGDGPDREGWKWVISLRERCAETGDCDGVTVLLGYRARWVRERLYIWVSRQCLLSIG